MLSVGSQIVKILGSAFHMVSLAGAQLCCCSVKTANDTRVNEQGCVPIKLYLRILKFEFHKMFMCHKIFLLLHFSTI